MNSEKKKFDIWPLVVGVIAAIGIIGSSSTGGITKQTREATSNVVSTSSTVLASSIREPDATYVMPSANIDSIQLVSLSSPVKAGNEADLVILAKPETEYMIEIRYGNSVSTVSGLEKKMSDLNGNVRWHWRVGPVSTRGEYLIIVAGGGQTLEIRFQVN